MLTVSAAKQYNGNSSETNRTVNTSEQTRKHAQYTALMVGLLVFNGTSNKDGLCHTYRVPDLQLLNTQ